MSILYRYISIFIRLYNNYFFNSKKLYEYNLKKKIFNYFLLKLLKVLIFIQ